MRTVGVTGDVAFPLLDGFVVLVLFKSNLADQEHGLSRQVLLQFRRRFAGVFQTLVSRRALRQSETLAGDELVESGYRLIETPVLVVRFADSVSRLDRARMLRHPGQEIRGGLDGSVQFIGGRGRHVVAPDDLPSYVARCHGRRGVLRFPGGEYLLQIFQLLASLSRLVRGQHRLGQVIPRGQDPFAGRRWVLLLLVQRPLLTANRAGPVGIELLEVRLEVLDGLAVVAGQLSGAGQLEHDLVLEFAADLHRQRLAVQVAGAGVIGRRCTHVMRIALGGHRVGELHQHASHVMLARGAKQPGRFRFVDPLRTAIVLLLDHRLGLEEQGLLPPDRVFVLRQNHLGSGNRRIVLPLVEQNQGMEVLGFVGVRSLRFHMRFEHFQGRSPSLVLHSGLGLGQRRRDRFGRLHPSLIASPRRFRVGRQPQRPAGQPQPSQAERSHHVYADNTDSPNHEHGPLSHEKVTAQTPLPTFY